MKERKIYVSLGLVCLLLGVVVTIQFRAATANPSTSGLHRVSELTARIGEISRERDLLVTEVVALRKQQMQSGNMSDEAIKMALAAGQLPGQGPGLRITLNDSLAAANDSPELYIVHDDDLRSLVNELRAGGAEAIAINGERITATTEIRCVGPTILVNLNRLTPPYVVDCVGDRDQLQAVLKLRGGWLDMYKYLIKVDIASMPNLVIPASKTPINYKYLKPINK